MTDGEKLSFDWSMECDYNVVPTLVSSDSDLTQGGPEPSKTIWETAVSPTSFGKYVVKMYICKVKS